MALDTFKARLKAKSTAAGAVLSNVRIEALAARLNKNNPDLTDESAHDTAIDALYEASDFKEMKTFDDYQRAKAAKEKRDKEQQQSSEADDVDDEDNPQEQQGKPKGRPSKLEKMMETLMAEVQSLKTEKQVSRTKEKLRESLKDVPESFYKKWKMPETDEEYEAFETDVKTEWENFTKENPIQTSSMGGKPPKVAKPGDVGGVSQDVKSFVEAQKQNNPQK